MLTLLLLLLFENCSLLQSSVTVCIVSCGASRVFIHWSHTVLIDLRELDDNLLGLQKVGGDFSPRYTVQQPLLKGTAELHYPAASVFHSDNFINGLDGDCRARLFQNSSEYPNCDRVGAFLNILWLVDSVLNIQGCKFGFLGGFSAIQSTESCCEFFPVFLAVTCAPPP